ncbi:uncharacterized protein LOC143427544 isoform X2 [Xylocopa sonorina]|uniref:uncharacterized protein LOC143427544 isoform X2 n=1 Tax=Xylocopa sonorina TaxID=1818115 RepID=UPI00403AE567
MPFMIESRSTHEINNKDRGHFLPLEMREDYSFKYIPESHFKHIVKNVQRQRQKEDEERVWASFVKEQELNSLQFEENDIDYYTGRTKDLLEENVQDVDSELKRLEDDAIPERSKGIQIHKPDDKNQVTYRRENTNRSNSKQKVLVKSKGTSDFVLPQTLRGNDISACKESEGLKIVFRSKAKKSLSDTSVVEKKIYTNRLLRATNHFENNSHTDSSNNRDDVIYVQPDPFTIQKLVSMRTKVAELLDEILFRLCRIPLPDGDNDLKRRQQQTLEFAIRFSRNYLYNLNRLVASIQRHIRAVTLQAELKQYNKNISFHQDMIKQKLITAHQLLIQALTAYYKHIPNSIPEGHSTKLQDALQVVCNLTNICDKIEVSTDYVCSGDSAVAPLGKNLEDKCDAILSQLKLNLKRKHRPANCKNVEPVATVSSCNKGRSNRKNLSSRLSMYSMDTKVSKSNRKRRNDLRRKNYMCQEENANNVKNIKDAYAQHYSLPELLYPTPRTHTPSSRDVRIDSVKNMNHSREDDIRTMMDGLIIDSENDSNVEIQTGSKTATKVEQSAAIRKKTFTEVRKSENIENAGTNTKLENDLNDDDDDLMNKITTITKEHLSSLAPVINNLVALLSKKGELEVQPALETSVEFLRKYQSLKSSDAKASSTNNNLEHSRCKLNGVSETQKRCENVQLVCISSMDKVSKMTKCDASCQADYETTDDKKIANLNIKDGIELVVSKEAELQFLTYRSQYKQLCQLRPMYSTNTQNKPWDIVAWISDKLIEELLIEITEDLQMKDIIKRLFEMEFQEF